MRTQRRTDHADGWTDGVPVYTILTNAQIATMTWAKIVADQ